MMNYQELNKDIESFPPKGGRSACAQDRLKRGHSAEIRKLRRKMKLEIMEKHNISEEELESHMKGELTSWEIRRLKEIANHQYKSGK